MQTDDDGNRRLRQTVMARARRLADDLASGTLRPEHLAERLEAVGVSAKMFAQSGLAFVDLVMRAQAWRDNCLEYDEARNAPDGVRHLLVGRKAVQTHGRWSRFSSVDDLTQVGHDAFETALWTYDRTRQAFAAYATRIIGRAMIDHVLAVIPKETRSLAVAVRVAQSELTRSLQRTPTNEEVAHRVGISVERLWEVQHSWVMLGADTSGPRDGFGDDEDGADEDDLADAGPSADADARLSGEGRGPRRRWVRHLPEIFREEIESWPADDVRLLLLKTGLTNRERQRRKTLKDRLETKVMAAAHTGLDDEPYAALVGRYRQGRHWLEPSDVECRGCRHVIGRLSSLELLEWMLPDRQVRTILDRRYRQCRSLVDVAATMGWPATRVLAHEFEGFRPLTPMQDLARKHEPAEAIAPPQRVTLLQYATGHIQSVATDPQALAAAQVLAWLFDDERAFAGTRRYLANGRYSMTTMSQRQLLSRAFVLQETLAPEREAALREVLYRVLATGGEGTADRRSEEEQS